MAFNAKQQNGSNKEFKIWVKFNTGFSIRQVQARSFAQACYRIEKEMSKNFTVITEFKLLEDKTETFETENNITK